MRRVLVTLIMFGFADISNSCTPTKEYTQIERMMKDGTIFPLDTISAKKGGVFRISYVKGNAVDSCSCTETTIEEEMPKGKSNYLFYIECLSGALNLLQENRIYKYNDGQPYTGFRYIVRYKQKDTKYYFSNNNLPQKITVMDSILLYHLTCD